MSYVKFFDHLIKNSDLADVSSPNYETKFLILFRSIDAVLKPKQRKLFTVIRSPAFNQALSDHKSFLMDFVDDLFSKEHSKEDFEIREKIICTRLMISFVESLVINIKKGNWKYDTTKEQCYINDLTFPPIFLSWALEECT